MTTSQNFASRKNLFDFTQLRKVKLENVLACTRHFETCSDISDWHVRYVTGFPIAISQRRASRNIPPASIRHLTLSNNILEASISKNSTGVHSTP